MFVVLVTSPGSRPLPSAVEHGAPETRQAVVDGGRDVGQRLVLEVLEADVVALELLACLLQVEPARHGLGDRGIHVDGRGRERRRVGRLERRVPEVRRPRVENQRAEPVLGLRDRLLADDHVLLVRGHFGFRLHDVDGGHRADLDALAVVAERLQRQFQRRPLHRRGPTAPPRDPSTRS